MRKVWIGLTSVFLVALPAVSGGDTCESCIQEEAAIRKVALDYIEGWLSGNHERMDKALHPELHKRGVVVMKKTGRILLTHASKSKMIELTRAAIGKKLKAKWGISFKLLDVSEKTACARVISSDYIDYLQLVKLDGQWKILNVIWEENKKDPKR